MPRKNSGARDGPPLKRIAKLFPAAIYALAEGKKLLWSGGGYGA